MRYVWTDAGDDPSWTIGDENGIDGYFAPLFDALTPSVLAEAARRGHVVGGYLGHNWFPGLSAEQLAVKVSAEYKRLQAALPTKKLRVMFNLEQHDPEYVADTHEEWRELHPFVGTSWSPEGMQGGWMAPEFVARMMACRVRIVPQAYAGSGRPIERRESDVVKADVVRRGFPENVVSCFYDAAQLGRDWDGFAYTMGHLPTT